MIVDINIGGVLIPGLLALVFVALGGTAVTMRFFTATGLSRLFAYRPLIELATFVIIYGLLVQHLPLLGLFS